MRTWNNAIRKCFGMKLRKRKGFTLIEASLSLVLSSIMLIGLVILVVEMKEMMWIDMQVRNVEEWGLGYVNTFTKYMRNGINPELTTRATPSRASVTYNDPFEVRERNREYEFRRDRGTRMPAIMKDGALERELLFVGSIDPRDNYEVDEKNFKISYNDYDLAFTSAHFDSSFITLEFTVTYTRDRNGFFGKTYTRDINFTGSAYVVNWNWPSTDNSQTQDE